MKKILFIAPFPPPYSGPESSAKMFIEAPIAEHFKIIPFNISFRKSARDRGKVGIYIVFIFLRFICGLVIRIIRYRPEIVYYYVTATKLGWIYKDIWCILGSKLLFRKVVIHMRAGHFRRNYTEMSWLYRKLVRYACSRVDLAIVQSDTLKDQFKDLVQPEKIEVVPNMIDTIKYAPDPSINKENEIFFMGFLSKAKGYTDLLKALPIVVEAHNDIKFSIAGTKLKKERNDITNFLTGERLTWEDPEEVYNAYIKGKFENNFTYLGVINETEKIAQFRKSLMFVLPSYSEGFSMSVLEAMSTGTPIIASPVGALSDIIENNSNGILIEPGNPKELGQAIILLLEDINLREKISKNSRSLVLEMFSKEIVSQKYVELFKKVLDT